MEIAEQKSTKKQRKKPSRRIGVIDLDRIKTAFLCVLKREAIRFLDKSYDSELGEEDSKKLVNYLKLLKQFEEQELAALEALTDDELEARARVNQKQGEN